MSRVQKVQKMRQFVAQRLHAAAEEILAVFEKTIDKYEQEAALNHEVISRQHALLCALHSPLVDLKSTDVFTQQLMVSKDAGPLEDKNQNQDKNQTQQQNQDPEPSQVKEEQDGEQLHLDEADIIKFTYSSGCAVTSGENLDPSARPGPAGPDQDVLLVSSSETEDSEDYNRDSVGPRPAPDRLNRRRARSRFTCWVCSRTFNARRFLFRHVKTHLEEASLVCGVCGDSFEAAEGLKLHLQTHLKKSSLQNQNQTETETGTGTWSSVRQQSNTNVQEEQKPDRCTDCGKKVWKKRRHRCRTWRKNQNPNSPEETKKKKTKT